MITRRFRVLAVLAAACCAPLAVLAAAGAQPSPRRLGLAVSPFPGDFALSELSFPHAHGTRLTERSLRLLAPSFSADDLIALATPAEPRHGARVALLLVADRITNLAEPVSVRLRALALAALGPVRVRSLENPIARHPAPPGWLCGLAAHGRAPALRVLGAHGRPISGLGAAGAVTQAFEIACGLPAGPQLRAALAPPRPVPAPEPAPTPSPGPEAPKCPPCNPKPGYACPLAASPAYCVAARSEAAPYAPPGAH